MRPTTRLDRPPVRKPDRNSEAQERHLLDQEDGDFLLAKPRESLEDRFARIPDRDREMVRQGAVAAAGRRMPVQWRPSAARRRSKGRPVARAARGRVGITQRRIASPRQIERDPFSSSDGMLPVLGSRRRCARKQLASLRDHHDPKFWKGMWGHRSQIDASEPDLAGGGSFEARQRAQRCSLSGAVSAKNGHHFALTNVKGYPFHRFERAIGDVQILDVKQRQALSPDTRLQRADHSGSPPASLRRSLRHNQER